MKSDSYTRFLRSNVYQDLAKKKVRVLSFIHKLISMYICMIVPVVGEL